MTDFNTPTNTTLYTSVLTYLNAKIQSVAKMAFSGDSNLPTDTKQWDSTTKKFQNWNGSSWVDLVVNFGDNVGIKTTSLLANQALDCRGRIAFGSGSGGDAELAWREHSSTSLAWQMSVRSDVGGSNQDLKFLRYSGGTYSDVPVQITQAAGYLLLNYTSSNGSYRLQVNSQIFATNATIATSDGRYKENVEEVADCLDAVCSLRPVAFDWKQHPVHEFTEGRDVGFIAQEVEEALSERPFLGSIVKRNATVLPDESTEEFLGLADSKLVPLLVGAVKELKAKNDALEARLAALEAKVG